MILAFLCWFVFVVCVCFLIMTSTITAEIFVILLHGKQSTNLSNKTAVLYTASPPDKSSSLADRATGLRFLVYKTKL